jgi:hypothetical protein
LLVAGLWQLRRRLARLAPVVVLMGLGLLYPLALALRLTQASTETSSRSSEFVFFGIAIAVALLAMDMSQQPAIGISAGAGAVTSSHGRLRMAVAIGLGLMSIGILATGAIVTGQAPYDRTTGAFIVNADTRSVGPLNDQTANWAAHHWPSGTIFLAGDITNQIAVGSAARFSPQGGLVSGLSVTYLFTSRKFDDLSRSIIDFDKIRYLVVDNRMSQVPSASGYTLQNGSAGAKRVVAQLPNISVDKFTAVAGLSRVYDNGVIRVYDTGRILR